MIIDYNNYKPFLTAGGILSYTYFTAWVDLSCLSSQDRIVVLNYEYQAYSDP